MKIKFKNFEKMHDKKINEEYKCSEFYINGRCYENAKLIINTVDIDSEFRPFYFEVRTNKFGTIFCQPFCHYGKITERMNGIIRFDIEINNARSNVGKIVLYPNDENDWIGSYKD